MARKELCTKCILEMGSWASGQKEWRWMCNECDEDQLPPLFKDTIGSGHDMYGLAGYLNRCGLIYATYDLNVSEKK